MLKNLHVKEELRAAQEQTAELNERIVFVIFVVVVVIINNNNQ